MGGKGGNKGKGVGRPTRASQIKARQAASAASYASYKASQTPAGQAAAAASAAATKGMTAQQAYNAGYRGMSAFGGAYTGGNLGDPNSSASRSYKATHGEAKYNKMVAEKGYSAPSYTAAGKAAGDASASTRAEQRVANYSGFTDALNQGEADKAFTNLQKQLKISDPTQSTWSKLTSGLSGAFNTAKDVYSHAGNLRNQMISKPLGSLIGSAANITQLPGQVRSGLGILSSGLTGEVHQGTYNKERLANTFADFARNDVQPSKVWGVGETPYTSDKTFVVRGKEAFPQTAETINQFPSLSQQYLGGDDQITGAGEGQFTIDRSDFWSGPTLSYNDIRIANTANQGDFPGGNFLAIPGLHVPGSGVAQRAIASLGDMLGGGAWGDKAQSYVGPDGQVQTTVPTGLSHMSGEMHWSEAPQVVKDKYFSDLQFNPTDMGLGTDISTSLGENYKSAFDKKVDASNEAHTDVGEYTAHGMTFSSDEDYQNMVSSLQKDFTRLQNVPSYVSDVVDFGKAVKETMDTGDFKSLMTDKHLPVANDIMNVWTASQTNETLDKVAKFFNKNYDKTWDDKQYSNVKGLLDTINRKEAYDESMADRIEANIQARIDKAEPGSAQEAYLNNPANIVKEKNILQDRWNRSYMAYDLFGLPGEEGDKVRDDVAKSVAAVSGAAQEGTFGEKWDAIGQEPGKVPYFRTTGAPEQFYNMFLTHKIGAMDRLSEGNTYAETGDMDTLARMYGWTKGESAEKMAQLQKRIEQYQGVKEFLGDPVKGIREKLGFDSDEVQRRRDATLSGGSGNNPFQNMQNIIRQYQQEASTQEQYDISQIWAGQSERDALYQQGLKDIASDQSLYTKELAAINEDQARYQAELDRVKAEGTEWGHDPEYQKYLTKVTGDVKGLSDYKTQTQSSLDALTSHLDTFKTSYTQDRQARTSAGIDYAQQWQSATRTPVMGIRANRGFNVSKSPWDTFGRKSRNKTSKDFTYTALNV